MIYTSHTHKFNARINVMRSFKLVFSLAFYRHNGLNYILFSFILIIYMIGSDLTGYKTRRFCLRKKI